MMCKIGFMDTLVSEKIIYYPECPYCKPGEYDVDMCTHPKKGQWYRCTTMHLEPIDRHSCPFDIYAELSGVPME